MAGRTGHFGGNLNHPETAHKAAHAFMQMSKIDIAKLEEAVKR